MTMRAQSGIAHELNAGYTSILILIRNIEHLVESTLKRRKRIAHRHKSLRRCRRGER
jgi:hypothetical protein